MCMFFKRLYGKWLKIAHVRYDVSVKMKYGNEIRKWNMEIEKGEFVRTHPFMLRIVRFALLFSGGKKFNYAGAPYPVGLVLASCIASWTLTVVPCGI